MEKISDNINIEKLNELFFYIGGLTDAAMKALNDKASFQLIINQYLKMMNHVFLADKTCLFLFNKKNNTFKGALGYCKVEEFELSADSKYVSIPVTDANELISNVCLLKKENYIEDVSVNKGLTVNANLLKLLKTKGIFVFPVIIWDNIESIIVMSTIDKSDKLKSNLEYINVVIKHLTAVFTCIKIKNLIKKIES